jgi:hypothetical protein
MCFSQPESMVMLTLLASVSSAPALRVSATAAAAAAARRPNDPITVASRELVVPATPPRAPLPRDRAWQIRVLLLATSFAQDAIKKRGPIGRGRYCLSRHRMPLVSEARARNTLDDVAGIVCRCQGLTTRHLVLAI